MVEMFLNILGRYAHAFIDWFVENTLVLSSIVVCYGLILAAAKSNRAKVEERLKDVLGVKDFKEAEEQLRREPLDKGRLKSLRSGLVPPIISSRNNLYFYAISNKSLIKIVSSRNMADQPS